MIQGLMIGSFWLFVLANGGFAFGQERPGVTESGVDSAGLSDPATLPQRIETQFVPNLVQVHERIYSGGVPEGDKAFAELQRLGVKTIISVDGAKPEVVLAEKYGLRYVHLPHGYDGIPGPRRVELAKAVTELPGPIYIHCHHGKHRSPAAAAVACVTAGLLAPGKASKVLRLAGTSPHYVGLYAAAEEARRIDTQRLRNTNVDFVPIAPVPPLAEAMVDLERYHDAMKMIAEASWVSPKSHPDLIPVHQALLFREQFTEMLRMEEVDNLSISFRKMIEQSELLARQIEILLEDRAGGELSGAVRDRLNQSLASITEQCKACHRQERDTPISTAR